SAQEIADRDHHIWKTRNGQPITTPCLASAAVRVILGFLEYQDTVAFSGRTERDDPQRRYAAARVSDGLTCGVVVECGISDLNHQEGIRAGRQRAFVIVRAGLQEHKIRLRLRRGTEHER